MRALRPAFASAVAHGAARSGSNRFIAFISSTSSRGLREVRRALRPDGTLWLNLGDCYATGAGAQGAAWQGKGPAGYRGDHAADPKNPSAELAGFQPDRMRQPGLKPKDFVGIPWDVGFASQDNGWWLRRDHIWAKPNPMPESVRDRCTSAHEYLFLLTKSERYFYDAEAIKEPFADRGRASHRAAGFRRPARQPGCYSRTSPRSKGATRERQDGGFLNGGGGWNTDGSAAGRNKRSVWTIATAPFSEAHFATFPPAFVEPCTLAGTSRAQRLLALRRSLAADPKEDGRKSLPAGSLRSSSRNRTVRE